MVGCRDLAFSIEWLALEKSEPLDSRGAERIGQSGVAVCDGGCASHVSRLRHDATDFLQITPELQYVANPAHDLDTESILVRGMFLYMAF